MVLQYRSKRRGFHFYVQGQTMEIGKQLFKLPIQMKITKQDLKATFNAVINMYIFFAIVEIGLSWIKQEPYSIYRVLLYSFLAHCIGGILSYLSPNSRT